jgi:hypothetical protein
MCPLRGPMDLFLSPLLLPMQSHSEKSDLLRLTQRLMTLLYEVIDDDFSSFTRLVTYWDASPVEKKIYMERTK